MHKFILSVLLAGTIGFANETKPAMHCTLSQEGPVKISWKAFKTPMKVGVGGTFATVNFKPVKQKGINFAEILTGASVTIDEASVDSGNQGRDVKLVKFFFEQMSGKQIVGKIVSVKHDPIVRGKPKTGILDVELTMNGITRKVPMRYRFDQGTLSAEGTIDLFDFNANNALQALNKACFTKHQGKTWNDVTIAFSTHIKAVCEPIKQK